MSWIQRLGTLETTAVPPETVVRATAITASALVPRSMRPAHRQSIATVVCTANAGRLPANANRPTCSAPTPIRAHCRRNSAPVAVVSTTVRSVWGKCAKSTWYWTIWLAARVLLALVPTECAPKLSARVLVRHVPVPPSVLHSLATARTILRPLGSGFAKA